MVPVTVAKLVQGVTSWPSFRRGPSVFAGFVTVGTDGARCEEADAERWWRPVCGQHSAGLADGSGRSRRGERGEGVISSRHSRSFIPIGCSRPSPWVRSRPRSRSPSTNVNHSGEQPASRAVGEEKRQVTVSSQGVGVWFFCAPRRDVLISLAAAVLFFDLYARSAFFFGVGGGVRCRSGRGQGSDAA